MNESEPKNQNAPSDSNVLSDSRSAPDEQIDSGLEVALVDVWPVFAMSKESGISLSEITARIGLPADLLEKPEGYIALADYFRILAELSLIYYDETCHLSDRPMILGTTQFMLNHLKECATLREAMYKVAEVANVLHGGPFNQVREVDGQLTFEIDDSRFPYLLETRSFLYCGMECVLILLHGTLSHITASSHNLTLPHISIKREPEPGARHLKYWGRRIRYQAQNYMLSYESSVGDRPIVVPEGGFSSKNLFIHVINLVQSPTQFYSLDSISEQVRHILFKDAADQQQVADVLGMSVATMRRRLKDEGTSFREIRQESLKTLALTLLDAGIQTYDVAEKLGFSDLRSFSRAFKGWHGTTPSEYRASKHP